MNKGYLWFALGIGAAFGGGIALLFAPQSGVRTRKQIGRAFEEAADQTSSYAEDANGYLKEQVDKFSAEAQKTLQQAGKKTTEFASMAADIIEKSTAQTKAKTSSMF